MVGGKGRIDNVHIISAVAAVPFQGVIGIIFNGQLGTILQIQHVVIAEIDCLGRIRHPSCVHGHGDIIQGQRSVRTGADRHPIPLSGVGGGANAVHDNIAVFKGQRFAPQGNAILGKGYRGLCFQPFGCLNGQVFAQIQATGGGVGQQLDGCSVRSRSDSLIQGSVCSVPNLRNRVFRGQGNRREEDQHHAQRHQSAEQAVT